MQYKSSKTGKLILSTMKETINVNIGSQAFTLDMDAYERLSDYFDDVRSRLAENDDDTMNDIEARFAEIFIESRSSSLMVVSLRIVEQAIARMGRPEDFGPERRERRKTKTDSYSRVNANTPRVIRRSRTDRSIAGVCGGLAEYFNIDATAIRLATLLLIIFGGLSVWVYIILWIVIPEETINTKFYERR